MGAGSKNERIGVLKEVDMLLQDHSRHKFSWSTLGFRCAKILRQDVGVLAELNRLLETPEKVAILHVSDTIILHSPQEVWLFPLESAAQYEDREFISAAEILEQLGKHGSVKDVMESVCLRWKPLAIMEMLQLYLDQQRRESIRGTCIQCLIFLNRHHELLPPSLHLENLTKDGSRPVSGGGFADIWKGRLGDTRDVCLKVLRVFADDMNWTRLMKETSNEILLWRQLQHPNILEFLGISTTLFEHTVAIVSPWMSNGTVMTFGQTQHCTTFNRKMRLIRGIVKGIAYLHEHNPPIIHGDIKGVNILVKDDEEPCIADFGLCSIQKETVFHTTSRAHERGSLPWLAPELLNPDDVPNINSRSRDIYALGCTIAEILSGSPPFSDKANPAQIILAVLLKGERPKRPVECPDWLWLLMESCWHADATKRPEVAEVYNRLNEDLPTLGHAMPAPSTTTLLSPLRWPLETRPTSPNHSTGAESSTTRSFASSGPAKDTSIADKLHTPEATARLASGHQLLQEPPHAHHVLAIGRSKTRDMPIATDNYIRAPGEGRSTQDFVQGQPNEAFTWLRESHPYSQSHNPPTPGMQHPYPSQARYQYPGNTGHPPTPSPGYRTNSMRGIWPGTQNPTQVQSNRDQLLQPESQRTESSGKDENAAQTPTGTPSQSVPLPALIQEPNRGEGPSIKGPSPNISPTMSSGQIRRVLGIACTECRRRKIRCKVRQNQACERCRANGLRCIYELITADLSDSDADDGGILLTQPYPNPRPPTLHDRGLWKDTQLREAWTAYRVRHGLGTETSWPRN